LSGASPIAINSAGAISIQVANTSQPGYLASADWNTFNGKQAALGYTPTNAAVVPSTAPSAGQILVGNAGGTAYAPVTASGSCTLASTGAFTCSGSGLSGMTAGQVPIAATASTVTSSEALAGTGAAIVTGPASSTSADAVIYTGTSGQTADAGFAPAPAVGNDTLETSSFTAACNQAPYDVSNAGAQTVTAPAVPATGNCIIIIKNKGAGTWTFTGSSNVYDLESATPGTLVSSATITTNQSRGITADGTNFWMSASAPTSVLTGITAPANGGTGATTPAGAESNLLSNPAPSTNGTNYDVSCTSTSLCVPSPTYTINITDVAFGAKCDVTLGADGNAATGVVNTSGTAVTWVSGDDFSGMYSGGGIVINGTLYNISVFNSSTSLTLTASAGSQTGATFLSGTDDTTPDQAALDSGAEVVNFCNSGTGYTRTTSTLTVPGGVVVNGYSINQGVVYSGSSAGPVFDLETSSSLINIATDNSTATSNSIAIKAEGGNTIQNILSFRNGNALMTGFVSLDIDGIWVTVDHAITFGQLAIDISNGFGTTPEGVQGWVTVQNSDIHAQHAINNSYILNEPAIIINNNYEAQIFLPNNVINVGGMVSTSSSCVIQYGTNPAETPQGNGNLSIDALISEQDNSSQNPYLGHAVCNTNGLTPTVLNGSINTQDSTGTFAAPYVSGAIIGKQTFDGQEYTNGIAAPSGVLQTCNAALIPVGGSGLCKAVLSAANLNAYDGTTTTAVSVISAAASGVYIVPNVTSSSANYVAGSQTYTSGGLLLTSLSGTCSTNLVFAALDTNVLTNEISFGNGASAGACASSVLNGQPLQIYSYTAISRGIQTSTLDAAGTGFAIGDTFTDSTCLNPATGHVVTISGVGVGPIATYTMDTPGAGCTVSTGDALIATSGSGTGATINITGLTANGNGTVTVNIPFVTVAAQ
jgi:hypothetical protein